MIANNKIGFSMSEFFILAKNNMFKNFKMSKPLQVCESCGGIGGDSIDGENIFATCEDCLGTTFKLESINW